MCVDPECCMACPVSHLLDCGWGIWSWKQVQIRDWKLGLVFWAFQLCVFAYLIARIILERAYLVGNVPIIMTELTTTDGQLSNVQVQAPF